MILWNLFLENIGRRFTEWTERRNDLDVHVCEDMIQRWRVR